MKHFSPTPSNSQTPSGCLTVQLNSVYLETARSQRLRVQPYVTAPPPLPLPLTSPGSHERFWLMGYRLRLSMTPYSGLISLLDQKREPFYLLDHQYIVKRCNSGTARWKRCIGQGRGEGARSFHVLFKHHTLLAFPRVYQPGTSLNSTLLGFYGVFINTGMVD